MYGFGKEVDSLAAQQGLAVNGNRLYGLHQGAGWGGMRSVQAPVVWEYGGAGNKVWDACSKVSDILYTACCNPTRAYIYPLMGKEQPNSLELLFGLLSLCETNIFQEQVYVYRGRSIFPRRKS